MCKHLPAVSCAAGIRVNDTAGIQSHKERDEAWEEANKALMDDMPITALYYPSFVALINEDQVENVELTLGNSFMFSHAEIVE